MDEIVRVVDALLLSAEKSVATPANWPNNHADQVGSCIDRARPQVHCDVTYKVPLVAVCS
jgi:hypothetical protein